MWAGSPIIGLIVAMVRPEMNQNPARRPIRSGNRLKSRAAEFDPDLCYAFWGNKTTVSPAICPALGLSCYSNNQPEGAHANALV